MFYKWHNNLLIVNFMILLKKFLLLNRTNAIPGSWCSQITSSQVKSESELMFSSKYHGNCIIESPVGCL